MECLHLLLLPTFPTIFDASIQEEGAPSIYGLLACPRRAGACSLRGGIFGGFFLNDFATPIKYSGTPGVLQNHSPSRPTLHAECQTGRGPPHHHHTEHTYMLHTYMYVHTCILHTCISDGGQCCIAKNKYHLNLEICFWSSMSNNLIAMLP